MKITEIERMKRPIKVLQFGGGVFLRGFFDWMLAKANACGAYCGNAVIVRAKTRGEDPLAGQNFMYTHVARDGEHSDVTLVDCIEGSIDPTNDYEGFLALAAEPSLEIVVSNTTEAGIVFDTADKSTDTPPNSFPAKLTLLLKRRFDLGLDGFIFVPCELIDRNGDNLKKTILSYAELWGYDKAFGEWIENKNIFCNTLVDRIVTGYPKDESIELGYEDKMLNTSEIFHLWVIETDYDLKKELPFDKVGLNVIVTDNLERYRTRKVRILNGAHTAMIPYALLEGVNTVGECMENEKISSHVKACVYDEIIPTLDLPYEELKDYADNVFERFRNVYIKHLCSSIALNSVSKFKVRVLPSIIEYKKRFGVAPEKLILSFAKLIEFYRTDMTNDDPAVCEFMRKSTVEEILANCELWDADLSYLAEDIKKAIKQP